MDQLRACRAFLQVAELGSFSRAADVLQQQQSQVSRLVAALEAHLGVRLLRRTTRAVRTTEEGELYRARLGPILGALDASEEEVRGRGRELSGSIRISCPPALGRHLLGPIVGEFLGLYGGVRIETLLHHDQAALVDDEVDIALHVGPLRTNSHPARRLASIAQFALGAPRYLDAAGPLGDPRQLLRFNCLCYGDGRRPQAWSFRRGALTTSVDVGGNFVADDVEVLMERCLEGLGIALLPAWLVRAAIADRRLVRVLAAWEAEALPLRAVTIGRHFRARRITTFLNFLAQRLKPRLVAAAG